MKELEKRSYTYFHHHCITLPISIIQTSHQKGHFKFSCSYLQISTYSGNNIIVIYELFFRDKFIIDLKSLSKTRNVRTDKEPSSQTIICQCLSYLKACTTLTQDFNTMLLLS